MVSVHGNEASDSGSIPGGFEAGPLQLVASRVPVIAQFTQTDCGPFQTAGKSPRGLLCETPPGGLGFEKGGQCDGLGQPRVNTLGCQALFSLVVRVHGYEACGPGFDPAAIHYN